MDGVDLEDFTRNCQKKKHHSEGVECVPNNLLHTTINNLPAQVPFQASSYTNYLHLNEKKNAKCLHWNCKI